MAFTYKKPTDSDLTKAYREKEKQLQEAKPSAFVARNYVPGTAAAMSEEYLNRYLNREPFKFNLNGNALYQQYKDNAQRQGKMAMMDTIGQASSMTGGFGNSWAQTVGQQVYNNSLAEVNNIIPELYQMAYDKYDDEGSELYAKYGVLADKEAAEYGRYLDEENLRRQAWEDQQNDWLTQMGWVRNDLNTSIDRDRADASEENSYTYQMEQDAIEQDRWQKEFDLSKSAAYSSGSGSEKIIYPSESRVEKFETALAEGKEAAWQQIEMMEAAGVSDPILKMYADMIEEKYGIDVPGITSTGVNSSVKYGASNPSRKNLKNMAM